MKKFTPLALIVAGGLAAPAGAAIVTQTFNVTPSTAGVDITIGTATGPQYTYSHVFTSYFDIPFEQDLLEGLSPSSLFTTDLFVDTLPTAQNEFTTESYKPFGSNAYVGLKFNIGAGSHYGIAHFGESGEDGLIPLVDVQYDDVAIAAVPEPEAWTMLIAGIGATGFAMRRSRRRTAVTA